METKILGFSLSFRLRLFLFTVLLTVLTVSFVSSLSTEPMTDDSSRVRIAEIEEASTDAKSLLDGDDHDLTTPLSTLTQLFSLLNIERIRGQLITAPVLQRPQFQRNPRAPPIL